MTDDDLDAIAVLLANRQDAYTMHHVSQAARALLAEVRRLRAEHAKDHVRLSLLDEIERLRVINSSLVDRVAAQSDLLTRRAEKPTTTDGGLP